MEVTVMGHIVSSCISFNILTKHDLDMPFCDFFVWGEANTRKQTQLPKRHDQYSVCVNLEAEQNQTACPMHASCTR